MRIDPQIYETLNESPIITLPAGTSGREVAWHFFSGTLVFAVALYGLARFSLRSFCISISLQFTTDRRPKPRSHKQPPKSQVPACK